MKSRLLFLITLCLLAGLFLLGQQALANRYEDADSANPTPTSQISPSSQEETPSQEEINMLPSAQAIRQFAQAEAITQVMNGIDVSVANFRLLQDDKVQVDVCYTLPDKKDWIVNAASLHTPEQDFLFLASYLIEIATVQEDGTKQVLTATTHGLEQKVILANDTFGYRCDTLEFSPYPLPTGKVDFSSLTLVINSLQARPREGQECEFYLTVVQEALSQNNTGIELACEQGEWGHYNLQVSQKPTNMTQEESIAIISNYAKKVWTIEGPWIFTGSIIRSETDP